MMLRPWLMLITATMVLAAESVAADLGPVACEGTYSHHLQGVCTDGEAVFFWCFTTQLVKTGRMGRVLRSVDVADHHGDLCFHEGKIYVAVNLGEFNRPPGHADSWVYVYEPDNLACLHKHKTPEVVHGAGGIAVHDGKFVIVGGLPEGMTENFAYEYDAAFVFRKRHTLSSGHTYLGIQTAAFSEGAWWFGCYGRPAAASIPASPPVLLKTDAALQSVNRFAFDCSLGIVPIRDGQFLVARGGMTQDKRHTGKLILALPNDREGLKLIAK